MKITVGALKQVIKEELERTIFEANPDDDDTTDFESEPTVTNVTKPEITKSSGESTKGEEERTKPQEPEQKITRDEIVAFKQEDEIEPLIVETRQFMYGLQKFIEHLSDPHDPLHGFFITRLQVPSNASDLVAKLKDFQSELIEKRIDQEREIAFYPPFELKSDTQGKLIQKGQYYWRVWPVRTLIVTGYNRSGKDKNTRTPQINSGVKVSTKVLISIPGLGEGKPYYWFAYQTGLIDTY